MAIVKGLVQFGQSNSLNLSNRLDIQLILSHIKVQLSFGNILLKTHLVMRSSLKTAGAKWNLNIYENVEALKTQKHSKETCPR